MKNIILIRFNQLTTLIENTYSWFTGNLDALYSSRQGLRQAVWICFWAIILYLTSRSFATYANETQISEESDSVVRILFYYLPTTTDPYIHLNEMKATIQKQVDQANYIYQNSGLAVTFEIAAIKPWPTWKDQPGWSEETSHQTLWPEKNAKAIYDAMRPYVANLWENKVLHRFHADVLFLVDYRDPEDTHCGWATIGTENGLLNQQKTGSYGVFRLGTGCGRAASVLAHEIGHLLGAAHGYGEELEASSYLGYGVQCAGKSTLMHPAFPKHDFVSDPKINIGGEACGYQDAADNRQLFHDRLPLLAAKVPSPESTATNETLIADNSNLASASSSEVGNKESNQDDQVSAAGSEEGGSGGSLRPEALIWPLLILLISNVQRRRSCTTSESSIAA